MYDSMIFVGRYVFRNISFGIHFCKIEPWHQVNILQWQKVRLMTDLHITCFHDEWGRGEGNYVCRLCLRIKFRNDLEMIFL